MVEVNTSFVFLVLLLKYEFKNRDDPGCTRYLHLKLHVIMKYNIQIAYIVWNNFCSTMDSLRDTQSGAGQMESLKNSQSGDCLESSGFYSRSNSWPCCSYDGVR